MTTEDYVVAFLSFLTSILLLAIGVSGVWLSARCLWESRIAKKLHKAWVCRGGENPNGVIYE